MGANAQTAVPAFVAGEVLTAAEMTQVNTGIPVFATTVTRDAAFGGTGEKTLAQGQYAYIEATSALMVYSGSAWQTVGGGLTYITQATPSAVSTISINNCFSSTYTNYLVLTNFSASVGANSTISFRLRVGGVDSSTNYNSQRYYAYSTTVGASANPGGTTQITACLLDATRPYSTYSAIAIGNPFAAVPTTVKSDSAYDDGSFYNIYNYVGYNTNSTSYDGFTLYTSGTSFTGTIRVYGYQNS
jgi:hypothetical protein